MFPRLFTLPLFDSTPDDAGNGGGGAPAPEPAPEPKPETAGDDATAKPAGSVFASAKNLLAGIGTKGAELSRLNGEVTALTAERDGLKTKLTEKEQIIASQAAQIATYQQHEAELNAVIAGLEKKQKDVDSEVIHQIAAAGVPAEALPTIGGSATAQAQSYEELSAAAEAATDPKEKGRLANLAIKARATALAAKKAAPLN